jgi:hypothetical protein
MQFQNTWDASVLSAVSQNTEAISQMSAQITDITNAVLRLSSSIVTLNQDVGILQAEITQVSSATRAAIISEAILIGNVTTRLVQMIDNTQSEINTLVQNAQGTDSSLDSLMAIIFRIYKDVDMHKSLLQEYYASVDRSSSFGGLNLRPFVNDVGSLRPMSSADILATKNINNADASVGEVRLLYTEDVPVTHARRAHEVRYSLRCDPDYLINNAAPYINIRQLLTHIGPQGCTSVSPWICRCAVLVTDKVVTLSSGVWPTSSTTPSMDLQTAVSQGYVASSGSLTSSSVTITDMTTLFSNMQLRCQDTSSAYTFGTGRRVRVASLYSLNFTDIALNSTQCVQAASLLVSSSSQQYNDFTYAILTYWVMAYNLIAVIHLPALEKKRFGTMPQGVSFRSSPFSTDPRAITTFRCEVAAFANILDQTPGTESPLNKIPIYEMRPITQTTVMTLTVTGVNERSIQVTNQNGTLTSPLNGVLGSTIQGNVTLTNTNSLYVGNKQVLPSVMYRAGNFLNLMDDSNEFVTWDIPQNLFGVGGYGSCHKVNYIFEDVSWTSGIYADVSLSSPINMSRQAQTYASYFDAFCADINPMNFMRQYVVNDGSTQPTCGNWCDGTTVGCTSWVKGSAHDNEWCTLLDYFIASSPSPRVTNYADVNGFITFTPVDWYMTGSFEIPLGPITEIILSSCPSTYNVTVNPDGGETTVTFTTTDTQTQTVYFIVTQGGNVNKDDNCKPPGTIMKNIPVDLSSIAPYTSPPFTPCGLQYANIKTADDKLCYPLMGISITVNSSGGGNGGSGGTPQEFTIVVADEVGVTLARIAAAQTKYENDLAYIQKYADANSDLASQVTNIINTYVNTINAQTASIANVASFSNQIANNTATINANTASVIADVTDAVKRRQAIDRLLNATNIILGNITILNEYINNITIATVLQNQKNIDSLNRLRDDSSSCSGIPIIGPAICGLGHIFGGVMSFFVTLIMYVIIGVLIYFLVVKCLLPLCSKVADKAMSSSSGTSGKSMSYERTSVGDD